MLITRKMLLTTAAACFVAIAASSPGLAQSKTVIRFLHNETDPPSIEFFNKVIAQFEAENPTIDIEMETADNDGRFQKILASANTRTLPDVIKVITLENYEFVKRGFVSPLDDVVDAIGRSDFVPESLVKIDGKVYAIPYTMGNNSNLYLRRDLFEAAGVKPPANLADMLTAAQKTRKGDVYGFIFPAAKNRASTLFFSALMWSNGGTYFDKDLKVTFDSPATVATLAYMRDLAKTAPQSIGAYSFGDIINGYLSGKTAMVMGLPRLAAALGKNAPELLAKTGMQSIPPGSSGAGIKMVSTDGYAIASERFGGKHQAEAKKFVQFLMSGDRPLQFALTAFPHLIPTLKSVQESSIKEGAPLIGGRVDMARTAFDVSNGLDFSTEAGARIENGKVVLSGVVNPYIGSIIARHIPAQAVQRVIFENEDPAAAAKWGAAEMVRMVEDLKSR
jgi:ABC-type glycerol-3-phosphate transport system substrate-binding protein